jgi:hypothetical protein
MRDHEELGVRLKRFFGGFYHSVRGDKGRKRRDRGRDRDGVALDVDDANRELE